MCETTRCTKNSPSESYCGILVTFIEFILCLFGKMPILEWLRLLHYAIVVKEPLLNVCRFAKISCIHLFVAFIFLIKLQIENKKKRKALCILHFM